MASIARYLPRCTKDLYQSISNIRNPNITIKDRENNAIKLAVLVGRTGMAAGICFAMRKGSLLAAGTLAAASFPAAALAGGAMFTKYGASILKTGLIVNRMDMAVVGITILATGYGLLDIYTGKKADGLLDVLKKHLLVHLEPSRSTSNDKKTSKPDKTIEHYLLIAGQILIAAGICFEMYKGSLLAAGLLASASFPATALAGSVLFINYGVITFAAGFRANQIYATIGGIFTFAIGSGLMDIYYGGTSNGLLDVFKNREFVETGKRAIVSLLNRF